MYETKLNKIWYLIKKIKTDNTLPIFSDFLEWFYRKLELNFVENSKNFELQKWDIFYIELWKNIWSELNKIRPCIVYSKKYANKWNTVIVIPLKSYKWTKTWFNILIKKTGLNKLKKDSIVDLTWIKQVSKNRIKWYIWKIENNILLQIDNKILNIFWIKKE